MKDRLAELQQHASPEEEEEAQPQVEKKTVVVRNGNTSSTIVEVPDEDEDEGEGGSGPLSETSIDGNNQEFMKMFFLSVKSVRDAIHQIEGFVQELQGKNDELMLSVSPEATKQLNETVSTLMSNISIKGQRIRKDLKKMEEENRALEEAHPESTDVRIRKTQHSTLSRKFVQVMTKYNDMQVEGKKKQNEALRRQIKIADPSISDAALDDAVQSGSMEGVFSGKKVKESEILLRDIQDRHLDILRLEQSLMELHEMFMDMAVIVESQGEMIDRIEYTVERAHGYVQSAARNTKAAVKYKKSAAKKRKMVILCCVCCCIIIAAAIIATFTSLFATRRI